MNEGHQRDQGALFGEIQRANEMGQLCNYVLVSKTRRNSFKAPVADSTAHFGCRTY